MSDNHFFTNHDKSHAARHAEWQAEEDAKSLGVRLDECRERAYGAVDDIMNGMRNAPHRTLERELERGRALQGLVACQRPTQLLLEEAEIYMGMLAKIEPVQGPKKTAYDHAEDSATDMAEKVDEIIVKGILDELAR